MIIYKATNKTNGMVYIGQTVGILKRRIQAHLCDSKKSNYHFHRSIHKYGIDGFDWEILSECDDMHTLNRLEQAWIWLYDSFNSGYNHTTGGGGTKGRVVTEETKAKLSKSGTGRVFTDEHRANLVKSWEIRDNSGENHPMYGKHRPDEVKAKIGKGNKGKKLTLETRAKMVESWKTRLPITEEIRKKQSVAQKEAQN